MLDIITIGDCTWDIFVGIDNARLSYGKQSHRPKELCLPYGQKIAIDNLFETIGGNAANIAVGLKRQGFEVGLVTEIGDDARGRLVYESLQKNLVSTNYVKILKKGKTRFSVVLNFKGERTLLSSFPQRSYTFPQIPQVKCIYYTSLGKSFEKLQKKLIDYLKKHPDTVLAANPGSYKLEHGLTALEKIFPYTSILFVNKEEAQKIVGKNMPVPLLLRRLQKKGIRTVVITDGAKGSFVACEGDYHSMEAYPAKVVSKTGAGDAYASGFLGAILSGHSITTAMHWGTKNAQSVIRHFGAQTGLLKKKDLEK